MVREEGEAVLPRVEHPNALAELPAPQAHRAVLGSGGEPLALDAEGVDRVRVALELVQQGAGDDVVHEQVPRGALPGAHDPGLLRVVGAVDAGELHRLPEGVVQAGHAADGADAELGELHADHLGLVLALLGGLYVHGVRVGPQVQGPDDALLGGARVVHARGLRLGHVEHAPRVAPAELSTEAQEDDEHEPLRAVLAGNSGEAGALDGDLLRHEAAAAAVEEPHAGVEGPAGRVEERPAEEARRRRLPRVQTPHPDHAVSVAADGHVAI
mmetsp:Transcript_19195/g.72532  ORF Transcript_19195/g.72532 Transcript_19195/m.72532 type:complete len:270 (-) Transcript_19195:1004-1813(-)